MAAKNQEPQTIHRARREHNRDLIRRMRNGESLTSFDSQASWFPPRPTIAKDPKAIARLYSESDEGQISNENTPNGVERTKLRLT